MAEEQRWQAPETHRPCANNCGFFGTPTTGDLCSKCYKDKFAKEDPLNGADLAMEATLRHLEPLISAQSAFPSPPSESAPPPAAVASQAAMESSFSSANPNRCSACRKRVGLTGFTCKCGETFCGSHRYPEKHGCGFDYKAPGREAIARANPVIKGKKLDKI